MGLRQYGKSPVSVLQSNAHHVRSAVLGCPQKCPVRQHLRRNLYREGDSHSQQQGNDDDRPHDACDEAAPLRRGVGGWACDYCDGQNDEEEQPSTTSDEVADKLTESTKLDRVVCLDLHALPIGTDRSVLNSH